MADLDGPDYNKGRGTLQWLWRGAKSGRNSAICAAPSITGLSGMICRSAQG